MRARELREVTPRNSNEDEAVWPAAKEPKLSSDLAREIVMALDWEPTLSSELALQCEKALGWEPTLSSELAIQCEKALSIEPTLSSDLGKSCALLVDLRLKSELAVTCERALHAESEAGTSSDSESDVSDDENEGYLSQEEQEHVKVTQHDSPQQSHGKQAAAATEFSLPGGMGSKPTRRDATELARKNLVFA